jgi:cytochrome c556
MLKLNTRIAVSLLALGAGVTFALAAGSVDDQIKTRQDEMKANGQALGALVNIIRGQTAYDAAAVKTALDTMRAAIAASTAINAWDVSAQGGTIVSRAKPEVWSNAAGFAAAEQQLADALTGLEATSDEAGFKAAFPALGAACKNCHEQFRAAEN